MSHPLTDQAAYLSVLCQTPAERIKPFVDALLPQLDEIELISNRTGLVMLPYTDSVQGTVFHLGEVLVAEAHVRLDEQEGYASVLGRDLQQALAVAILDAAVQAGRLTDEIGRFVERETAVQAAAEETLLRQVEATRVEMETF